MKKKQVFKRLLSGVLAAAVTVSAVVVPTSANEGIKLKLSEVSSEGFLTRPTGDKLNEVENNDYADTDVVRVSIFLDGASTINAGFDIDTIATDHKAIAYRDSLKDKQAAVEEKIEKATSEELDVVHNLTLAANVISANVKFGQIKAIEKISGVKSVVIENQYEAAKSVENLADDPNMSTSTNQIGSNVVWAEGYTGAGSKVAVIDTGIDTTHKSFDEGAYLYSLSLIAEEKGMTLDEYKATLNLLDAAYIEKVADQLNVNIDVDKVNVSEKIPFAYNYVDRNYDVTHANDTQGEHGSHVEGIAAANKYIKDNYGVYVPALSAVKVQGVAPDAQIITMKVFGTKGGAYDSDYMLAIEDAVVLGADAINLSLGSGMGGNSKHATAEYQQIFEDLSKSGAVVSISAGNAGHWADSATTGGYLYADDVNTQTDGSPGSYTNAFTVASADNIGLTGEYFTIGETPVVYTQTDYTNKPLATLAGEQEYVYLDAVFGEGEVLISGGGTDEEWAAVGEALKGKIAVCSRGVTSFYQKAESAVAAGAIAVIVYNNQAGSINMDLSGYTKDAPVISITQAEGALFKENGTLSADGKYYTGTIDIEAGVGSAIVNTGFSTISSFSSWGVPGSLELKPEITAPGGNIYSVHGYAYDSTTGQYAGGNDSYENMSGTSMAAPQVAGMSALAAQYIRENGLEEKTGLKARTLAQSLLMSTAEPMFESLPVDIDEETGDYIYGDFYYSILRQGAGLANIGNVVKAESYILMDKDANAGAADGKVKVELGDDPDKKGVYTFGFTLYNLTDVAKAYTLSADMFTQYIFADKDDHDNLYMDTATEYLGAAAEFDCGDVAFVPAKGEVHVTATITLTDEDKEYLDEFCESGAYIEGFVYAVPYMMYDFDGDGDVDTDDGQRILDYRTGVETKIYNKEYADIDGDGDIDTYDAYLFLSLFEEGKLQIVEGEGIVGTTHSIPVLGFYGNWSTASMFDKGSYVDYELAETEDRTPYLENEDVNAFGVTFGEDGPYYLGGNLMVKDLTYHADRAAVNNTNGTYLSMLQYAAIRNAADSLFTIVNDTTGETILETAMGAVTAAYYYTNGGQWRNTAYSFKPNYDFSGAKENEKVTISFQLAPEYYLDAEGNVRWEDVDMTNALSTTVTIDNTAPKIESAALNGSTLTVTAQDNQYIAAVALVNKGNTKTYAYCGSSETQKAGEAVKFELDVADVNADQLYLQVYDYALNVTTYAVPEKFGEGTVIPSAVAFDAANGEWVTYDRETDTIESLEGSNYTFTAATVVDHIVYAVDENSVLYTMPEKDLSDTTRVVDLNYFFGQEVVIYDMAYDPTLDMLFVLVNGAYVAPINLLTGEVEGLYRTPFTTTTLAIDDDGYFYSNRINTGYVYRWNLLGAPTQLIAQFEDTNHKGLPYLQSMAYDSATQTVGWELVDIYDLFGIIQIPITTYVEIDINAEDPMEAMTVCEDQLFYQLTSLIFTDKTTESVTPDWAEPTKDVEAVYIDVLNPYVSMLKDSTLQLTADVAPWTATDRTVTWESTDEKVATVDKNGLVTAVGVGQAYIVATSNADEDVYDVISVTVDTLNITINGVLQDVDGSPLIYKWDMSKGEMWEKIADLDSTVESVTVNGKNGHLYVMDATENVWAVHEIDPATGEEIRTFDNGSGVPFVDMAYSDKFSTADDAKIASAYYYYFLAPQSVSNLSTRAFNLSGRIDSFIVAIANIGEEVIYDEDDDVYYETEKYAILDNAGTLLIFAVFPVGDSFSAYVSTYQTGITEEYPGFMDYDLTASMVMGNDGVLYLSAFNGESNNFYQIFLDEDEGTCSSRFIGNAGDGVWPVAISSVTVNEKAASDNGTNEAAGIEISREKFNVEEKLVIEKLFGAAETVELEAVAAEDFVNFDPSAIVKPERTTLVDAAEDVATEPSGEGKGDTSATVDGDKLTVTIVPKDEDGKNVDTTNGLFRVTYDTSKLTLVSTDVNADYESVNDAAEGKVVIGYVNPAEALAAGDKAVEMVFTVKEGAELDSSSLVVDHAEVIDSNYDKFDAEGNVTEEGKTIEEKPLADPENPEDPTTSDPTPSDPTTTDPDTNKPTGIAIAIVPALVSAAAVMVSKKRRNRK